MMSWFCSQAAETRTLYDEMDNELYVEDEQIAIDNEEIDEEEEGEDQIPQGNRVGLHSKGLNLALAIHRLRLTLYSIGYAVRPPYSD